MTDGVHDRIGNRRPYCDHDEFGNSAWDGICRIWRDENLLDVMDRTVRGEGNVIAIEIPFAICRAIRICRQLLQQGMPDSHRPAAIHLTFDKVPLDDGSRSQNMHTPDQ